MELDVDFIDIDTCEPVPVSRSFRLLSSLTERYNKLIERVG